MFIRLQLFNRLPLFIRLQLFNRLPLFIRLQLFIRLPLFIRFQLYNCCPLSSLLLSRLVEGYRGTPVRRGDPRQQDEHGCPQTVPGH